ncbi:MAG: hypothetical protein QOF48_2598 [Verrucomicrobiota bacterium]|jgi:hypothetical protein
MNKPTLTAIALAIAGAFTSVEAKTDFGKEVYPVLKENCFKCHGTEKQKGKLRLDSREAALKGGKNGPAFVPGDVSKSEMIRRINLPKTDDDFMPAEGEPLAKEKIELLKAWIAEGAEWSATPVADEKTGPARIPGPVLPPDFKPSAAEQKAIAGFAQKGIDIRPVAINSPWREANLRLHSTNISDATLAPLKDILGLVDLNLATTKVTDAGLAHLKPLVNLQRLHLELTAVTDAGLAQIKALPHLTYLNLYGTKVTDSGLEQLKGMKYLRGLYVWQTKVTDAGVKKLKAALPNLEISTGWDATTIAKMDEKTAPAKKDDAAADKKKKAPKPAVKKEDAPEKAADKPADKPAEKPAVKPEEKKN